MLDPVLASRTSLDDEITAKIIAEFEAGRVPWVQPWGTAAAKAPLAMPKNASTGRILFRDQRANPLGALAECEKQPQGDRKSVV